jgi:hypothetical protein
MKHVVGLLMLLLAFAWPIEAHSQKPTSPGPTTSPVIKVPLGPSLGGHPRLIVTPERRAVWARMKADFDANPTTPRSLGGTWYKLIKTNAECVCRYSDNGLWATLMFQITGERTYVDLAYARITNTFLNLDASRISEDFSRENFIRYVLMYDWLYRALTPAQRQQLLAKLNAMTTTVVTNTNAPAFPVRAGDSDQMVGNYFGLAAFYLASSDENPSIVEAWAKPFVGGFVATGTDTTTFRNVIKRYVTNFAVGGEWIESESYNLGTVKLLTLGAEMVKTGSGRDYFPEITALVPQLALRWIHRVTPDLKQAYQWGDEEHPRDFVGRLFYRVETAMVLAGLTQQDSSSGPYIQDLVLSLVEKYGATGYLTAEPWARGFLVYNPYSSRMSRAALPLASYASGMGMLQYRTGWTDTNSLFSAHFPGFNESDGLIDHTPTYFGEFQLYRKGEWAITHPLGYAGPSLDGRGSNGVLVGGLPWMYWAPRELKQPVAWDTSSDFAYLKGTLGGQVSANGAWNPPPTFVHEWTRSLVYVPAFEAVVVYDRVNAQDPRALDLSGYDAKVQQQIRGIPALKQWFIHTPVLPRIGSGQIEWDLPSRAHVRVEVLLPTGYVAAIDNEKLTWPSGTPSSGYMSADEKRWHVRISPPADRPWDTFLNVVQVFDGSPSTSRLVRSADGQIEGVVLAGSGRDSVALFFNATPSSRLPDGRYSQAIRNALLMASWRRDAYTVDFEASTGVTKVLLMDLDPALSWSVNVDGRGEMALPSSPVKALSVSFPGTHRIQVTPGR